MLILKALHDLLSDEKEVPMYATISVKNKYMYIYIHTCTHAYSHQHK